MDTLKLSAGSVYESFSGGKRARWSKDRGIVFINENVAGDDEGQIEINAPGRAAEIATLIAAAPDLLAALREIEAALRKDARDKTIGREDVEYHLDGQTMYRAINLARAAIAKAEGRS